MAGRVRTRRLDGVTVISCTKRRHCMNMLFRNYARQTYEPKELIVVLNGKHLREKDYIQAAKAYRNVTIYSLADYISLGNCLNDAIHRATYPFIAKFDDDDYYAPSYLSDSMKTLLRTGADITGKRAHYMYLNGSKQLLLRYGSMANRRVPVIQGATLLARREVFEEVPFRDVNRGECVKFCKDSRAQGFKIYAGSPYHFLAYRSKNTKDHTWIVSDRELISKANRVLKVKNPRKFVRS